MVKNIGLQYFGEIKARQFQFLQFSVRWFLNFLFVRSYCFAVCCAWQLHIYSVYSSYLQKRCRRPHSVLAANAAASSHYNFPLTTRQTAHNIRSRCSTFIHTGSTKCVHHGIGSFAWWNESFGRNVLISWSLRARLIIGWIYWSGMAAFPLSLQVYSNITKSSFGIRLGDASRVTHLMTWVLKNSPSTGRCTPYRLQRQTFTRIFGRIVWGSTPPHHCQNWNTLCHVYKHPMGQTESQLLASSFLHNVQTLCSKTSQQCFTALPPQCDTASQDQGFEHIVHRPEL